MLEKSSNSKRSKMSNFIQRCKSAARYHFRAARASFLNSLSKVEKLQDQKILLQRHIRKLENKIYKDRPQWRRWYQANKKYQRQVRAIRQRGGLRGVIMPSSLPRWMIP